MRQRHNYMHDSHPAGGKMRISGYAPWALDKRKHDLAPKLSSTINRAPRTSRSSSQKSGTHRGVFLLSGGQSENGDQDCPAFRSGGFATFGHSIPEYYLSETPRPPKYQSLRKRFNGRGRGRRRHRRRSGRKIRVTRRGSRNPNKGDFGAEISHEV